MGTNPFYPRHPRPSAVNLLQLVMRSWREVRIVSLSEELIQEIVRTNDKQRFALSTDGAKIRANQGHSIAVELALAPRQPPEFLFHGTATRFLDSIRKEGLKSMSRQHVHLSIDEATATKVARRHGKPVILKVKPPRCGGQAGSSSSPRTASG